MINLENLQLVEENSNVLKMVANEVDFSNVDIDLNKLTHYMYRIMYSSKGIGLASNQVGLLYRHFVFGDDTERHSCFNPQVLSYSSETVEMVEGCLSFPKLFLKIRRPKTIEAMWYDHNEKQVIKKLEGISARCFQHELDHINGVCFTDKVSKLKLNMAKKSRNKLARRTINDR